MPKRELIGIVKSNKGDKTVVLSVNVRKTHPLYKKKYTASKKFYAHDEDNTCNIGDKVKFIEATPMSKLKRWQVVEVLEKSSGPGVEV